MNDVAAHENGKYREESLAAQFYAHSPSRRPEGPSGSHNKNPTSGHTGKVPLKEAKLMLYRKPPPWRDLPTHPPPPKSQSKMPRSVFDMEPPSSSHGSRFPLDSPLTRVPSATSVPGKKRPNVHTLSALGNMLSMVQSRSETPTKVDAASSAVKSRRTLASTNPFARSAQATRPTISLTAKAAQLAASFADSPPSCEPSSRPVVLIAPPLLEVPRAAPTRVTEASLMSPKTGPSTSKTIPCKRPAPSDILDPPSKRPPKKEYGILSLPVPIFPEMAWKSLSAHKPKQATLAKVQTSLPATLGKNPKTTLKRGSAPSAATRPLEMVADSATVRRERAGRKENEDGAGTKRVIISNKKGGQRRESGKFDWKSWSKG